MRPNDELNRVLRQWRKEREAEERALDEAFTGSGCAAQLALYLMLSILMVGLIAVLAILSAVLP